MKADEAMEHYRGVVRLADQPELRSAWARHSRQGRVIRALPGVVMDAALDLDPGAWIRAVHAWDPNAVIAGRAAAWLTFAPAIGVDHVSVYSRSRLSDRGLIRFRTHTLDPEATAWAGDLRVTNPAATALTAALEGDYEPATTALRSELVSVGSLQEAAPLLRVRPAEKLQGVLEDLSGNPWSVAEVHAHRMLRRMGMSGWFGNYSVLVDGERFAIDIALPEAKIGFEVNSFEFHSSREAMARDAARLNALTAAGWRLYTLLPDQITRQPEATEAWVCRVLRTRDLRKRPTSPGEIFRR